jgi:serine/threonine protein phosphatase PrpC
MISTTQGTDTSIATGGLQLDYQQTPKGYPKSKLGEIPERQVVKGEASKLGYADEEMVKGEARKLGYKFYSYATSQCGYTPYSTKVNQDAFIIKSYCILGAALDIYIVCDGHGKGGEKVSEFCIREIPEMIKRSIEKRKLVSDQIIEDSIKDSCELSQKLLEKSYIQIKMAGTTFVITVIWNEKIFMGTCGDSRAFLASKKGNNVVCRLTTEDHKPEDP